jgi:hypothetical protein
MYVLYCNQSCLQWQIDDMYLAIYSLLNVSDRLRWRVANVKPIPESLTGPQCTEQRTWWYWLKWIYITRPSKICVHRRAFSQAVATSMQDISMIDLKSACQEPYIDVDMREFSVYYNVAHVGSRVCRPILQIRSQFTVRWTHDMGKRIAEPAQRVSAIIQRW